MKEYFKYMIIGFFIPYIIAWLFVFLFGCDTPDIYDSEMKGFLICFMFISAFFGLLTKNAKDNNY